MSLIPATNLNTEIGSVPAQFQNAAEKLTPAASFPEFFDGNRAALLLSKVRWKNGHTCPRCGSTLIKKINSSVLTELLKCVNCAYSFNFRSGTVIHGSKLSPETLLQFILVRDVLGQNCSPRLVANKVDVTDQTARALLKRFSVIEFDAGYVRKAPLRLRQVEFIPNDLTELHSEFAFFVLAGQIDISADRFEERLAKILAPSKDAL